MVTSNAFKKEESCSDKQVVFDGAVCSQQQSHQLIVALILFGASLFFDLLKCIFPLSQYMALVVPPSQYESTTKRFLPAIAETKTGKSKN